MEGPVRHRGDETIRNRAEWLEAERELKGARQFGRTTGNILVVIGNAMKQPGMRMVLVDHYTKGGRQWARELVVRAEHIIRQLGLRNVSVLYDDREAKIEIMSTNFGVRTPW